jgi:hypothetical protein
MMMRIIGGNWYNINYKSVKTLQNTTEMNYVNVVYVDANIPLLSDRAHLGYRLN